MAHVNKKFVMMGENPIPKTLVFISSSDNIPKIN